MSATGLSGDCVGGTIPTPTSLTPLTGSSFQGTGLPAGYSFTFDVSTLTATYTTPAGTFTCGVTLQSCNSGGFITLFGVMDVTSDPCTGQIQWDFALA